MDGERGLLSYFGLQRDSPGSALGLEGKRLTLDACAHFTLGGRVELVVLQPVTLHEDPKGERAPGEVTREPLHFDVKLVLQKVVGAGFGAAFRLWGDIPIAQAGDYAFGGSILFDARLPLWRLGTLILTLNLGAAFRSSAAERFTWDGFTCGGGLAVPLFWGLRVQAEFHCLLALAHLAEGPAVDGLAGIVWQTPTFALSLGGGGDLRRFDTTLDNFRLFLSLHGTFWNTERPRAAPRDKGALESIECWLTDSCGEKQQRMVVQALRELGRFEQKMLLAEAGRARAEAARHVGDKKIQENVPIDEGLKVSIEIR